MAKLTPLYDAFTAALGERLKRYLFPSKPKANGFYQQATPAGYIGIHVAPIHRWPIGVDVTAQFAISNSVVQKILSKTELYDNPPKLTWSCGAMLSSAMHALQFQCEPMPDGTSFSRKLEAASTLERSMLTGIWLSAKADAQEVARVADHAYWQVEQFAWPTLKQHGFSNEGFLQLTLRDDDLARLLFMDPRKELSGLILARHLGKEEAAQELLELARHRFAGYAAHGNREPAETFERLVKLLKLELR